MSPFLPSVTDPFAGPCSWHLSSVWVVGVGLGLQKQLQEKGV